MRSESDDDIGWQVKSGVGGNAVEDHRQWAGVRNLHIPEAEPRTGDALSADILSSAANLVENPT